MNASQRQMAYPTPILPEIDITKALDSEFAVLAAGLLSKQSRELLSHSLTEVDLFNVNHKLIFRALQSYSDTAVIDSVLFAKGLNIANAKTLVADLLVDGGCDFTNIQQHIARIKEAAARRKEIELAQEIIKKACDPNEPFAVPKLPEWTLENTRPKWILQEPEPFEFIIPGLLAKGLVGFIYGSGGTYKSLAALWLVLQRGTGKVIVGQKWFDRFEVPFGRSIFFSAEDVLLDLHHRINNCLPTMLHARPDVPLSALQSEVLENCTFIPREQWVVDGTLFLFDENGPTNKAEKIVELVNSFGADLVILETCSRIFPLDENDNTAGARLVGVLEYIRDKTGATILIIDHSSKMNRGGKTDLQGQNSLRGAGSKLDNARFGLLIEAQKRENGLDILQVTNSKTFRCKKVDSFRVSVDYPRFSLLQDTEGDESVFDVVIQYVREHPGAATRDIRSNVTGKTTAITQALKDGKEEGVLIFKGKGKGWYVE